MLFTLLLIASVVSSVLTLWYIIGCVIDKHTKAINTNRETINSLVRRLNDINKILNNKISILDKNQRCHFDNVYTKLKEHDKDIKDITNDLYTLLY